MAFSRPNGDGGFSWKAHLEYLTDKNPENLKSIAIAKLNLLARENPDQADYFSDLADELELKIYRENEANEKRTLEQKGVEESLSYEEEQAIVEQYLQEHGMSWILEGNDNPYQTTLRWCSSCEDFTPHKTMESDLGFKCTKCPQATKSAAESYIDTAYRTLGKLLHKLQ
ncbi:hypothetical protein G7B40_031320 [Aetokthonos hydrillicola Thurmond2011]|jgi:hypothetical protein|uniref:Uncharacterized protein n=1 Tax=Aetokthonos hydrillicola Thurmond2011 TaxID=2712845 RepID=A0AAP5M8C9_9CYAN|nr:hypothetical protein [Aetokthonos hydrillicola]MBO3463265.1 hypothetical protein [Aetokthonos hydrillicola CCALA 1050]MBW4590510.1 hypothetical protein [Aetokthonos hydrillicola CCALA 1050]MDR9899016.1 hypothetical protein [Aetokthonos hydrillicola Thurmond2011]